MQGFKWYVVYYDDDGNVNWVEFDIKGQLKNYIANLPSDYLIIAEIYGKINRKLG